MCLDMHRTREERESLVRPLISKSKPKNKNGKITIIGYK